MSSAKEMRKRTEEAALENIRTLIEYSADKGRSEVDVSEYDALLLTDEMKEKLNADGYKISGSVIRW